jgi:hypothetical protein
MRFIQIGVNDIVAAQHIVRAVASTDGPKGTCTRIDLSEGQSVYTPLALSTVVDLSGAELASVTSRGLMMAEPTPIIQRPLG